MNRLDKKVALVTGATSGIGEASAIRFAEAGAYVAVTGRNIERGKRIVDRISKSGGNACFEELDVSDNDSISKAIRHIVDTYGKLDILFNNAGIFPISPSLEGLTREQGNNIWDVNVSGTVMIIQACLPLLEESHGVILNNASVSGLQSYSSGQSYMYSASKAAVIKITQLIAKKYGNKLRANCICPGVVRTPVWLNFDEERYKSKIPMGRIGEPEDIATVANFLVSDDACFVNGAVIPVDGGQSL